MPRVVGPRHRAAGQARFAGRGRALELSSSRPQGERIPTVRRPSSGLFVAHL